MTEQAARLVELAERCEKAKVGEQRVLLGNAYLAVSGGPECTPTQQWPGYASPQWDRFHAMLDAEAYESAAMALIPEGWDHGCGNHDATGKAWAWVAESEDARGEFWQTVQTRNAATPALALVAASLRAKASTLSTGAA